MKKIKILSLLIACLLLLGCSTKQPKETKQKQYEYYPDYDNVFWNTDKKLGIEAFEGNEPIRLDEILFYDHKMTHKPTEADIARITPLMRFYDVIEILGRPHGSAMSGISYEVGVGFRWETEEGNNYGIYFEGIHLGDTDAWDNLTDSLETRNELYMYRYAVSLFSVTKTPITEN